MEYEFYEDQGETLSVINASEKWKVFQGPIHKLQQTGIGGIIKVKAPKGFNRQIAGEYLSRFLDNPLPENTEINQDNLWIVTKCIQWILALQKQCRIVVSERFHVHDTQNSVDQYTDFDAVIPLSVPMNEVRLILQWLDKLLFRAASIHDMKALLPINNDQEIADFSQLKKRLHRYKETGVNRFFIAEAAYRMDIPIARINSGTFCLGTGSQARLFFSTVTDSTPSIGIGIANNKFATTGFFRNLGMPVPDNALAKSEKHAVQLAKEIGMPVVIKPADADQGRGVAADLRDSSSVISAFNDARAISSEILVEKHIDGFTHRFTVLNYRLLKVVKRIAGGVVGDGNLNITELVKLAQKDERLERIQARLNRILLSLDKEALSLLDQHNLTPDSVPAAGSYVRLRRRDNVNAGANNVLIPIDKVHPDNQALAIRAAKLLRLDIAGIDIISTDIMRPWFETGAVICEVNAQPQLGITDTPDIYHEILSELIPSPYRMPLHLVLEPLSTGLTAARKHQLRKQLSCQGMSDKEGLWLDGQRISKAFKNGFEAAKALLICNDVASALCIMTAEEILNFGAPSDYFDSIIIVNRESCTAEEQNLIAKAQFLIEKQAGELTHI